MSVTGGVRKMLHRLSADDRELQAEQLREVVDEAGATPVSGCRDRSRVCLAGTLRSVTLQPRAGAPALEAELWDGSGTVQLVWLGRRRINGIEPGRELVVRGRLCTAGGTRTVYNPEYELRSTEA